MKKKELIIVAAAAVALVIAGVLFYFIFASNKDKKPDIALPEPTQGTEQGAISTPPPAIALPDSDNLESADTAQGTTSTPLPEPDGIPDKGQEQKPTKMSYSSDYEKFKKLNKDTYGWLSVPNTHIEYPVMLGKDNDFYLKHNPAKEYSKSGSVYLDFRNADSESSKHKIIYGHNMRNGTMFHDLRNFKNRDFFNNTTTITLYENGKKVNYKIYSAFVTTASENYIKTRFASDDEFLQYVKKYQDMSLFKPKKAITISPTDEILTLSTCSYEYDDSRFVVQAVKV